MALYGYFSLPNAVPSCSWDCLQFQETSIWQGSCFHCRFIHGTKEKFPGPYPYTENFEARGDISWEGEGSLESLWTGNLSLQVFVKECQNLPIIHNPENTNIHTHTKAHTQSTGYQRAAENVFSYFSEL
jgi:hypothetical protein